MFPSLQMRLAALLGDIPASMISVSTIQGRDHRAGILLRSQVYQMWDQDVKAGGSDLRLKLKESYLIRLHGREFRYR